LEVLKTAPNLATATSKGTAVRVQCGALIDCTYEGAPTLHGLGADLPTHPGILHANTSVEKSTQSHPKAFCPSTSTWLALYETLEDVYVKSFAKGLTALCKSDEGGDLNCQEGNLVTEIHAVAKNPLLHSSIVDVLCNESLAKAEVSGPGKPQIAHLTALTWTECHRHSGAACTVTTILLGLILGLKTKANFATLQSHDSAVRVQCGAFINCVYEGLPTLDGLGADLPTHAGIAHANTTVIKSSDPDHVSSICPSTSTWLALYESLKDVYVKSSDKGA
jgi:hypothetical protein